MKQFPKTGLPGAWAEVKANGMQVDFDMFKKEMGGQYHIQAGAPRQERAAAGHGAPAPLCGWLNEMARGETGHLDHFQPAYQCGVRPGCVIAQ
ncbi:hypothetical protein [Mesorhizobium sp. BH1-1-4]|uniref:hypothetical protein n=1 Tax=Mesorhizobium sp. BH1-1-4 TaxID=2876662 RepID=UPI001CD1889D|nr:hypothetical protein [Mesorhizobium sp. BH1-1-4]MBZ9997150.1 hypothetical protein [Mesorhizobium sp. BH1-1-4]